MKHTNQSTPIGQRARHLKIEDLRQEIITLKLNEPYSKGIRAKLQELDQLIDNRE